MGKESSARAYRMFYRRKPHLGEPGWGGRVARRVVAVVQQKWRRRAEVKAQREAWEKYEQDFQRDLLIFLRALSSARKRGSEPAAWNIENQIGSLIGGAVARGLSRRLIRRLAEDLPWDDPGLGKVMHPKANRTMWNLFVAGRVSLPMNPVLGGVAL